MVFFLYLCDFCFDFLFIIGLFLEYKFFISYRNDSFVRFLGNVGYLLVMIR